MNQDLKIEIARPISMLRTQIQDGIRELILDGKVLPGERLPERALIEATGVSRPVLREALAHLEARGLVEYIPNTGRVVARVSHQKAVDIYEVRAVLESTAASFFATRATEEAMAALRGACDEIRTAFSLGEMPKIRAATTKYYTVLLNGCGNAEVGIALEPLLDRITFLRTHSVSLPERRERSLQEMEEMTAAILRRDAAAARVASERHVHAAMEAALLRL